jgi:amino acid transporter
MGICAICLGLTFAKLARLRPETGGPYAYIRFAYGDFPGFLICLGVLDLDPWLQRLPRYRQLP